MTEADVAATSARMALVRVNGALKDQQERVKTMRAEIAQAQTAIRSAQSMQEKEQIERSALMSA